MDYYEKFGYTKEFLDKMIPKYTNYCMCSGCGKFFNSEAAFDMHRIDVPAPKYRRCLKGHEMLEKGMSVNKKGRWVTKEFDSTRPVFTKETTSDETKGRV